jgi:hypothetical protein
MNGIVMLRISVRIQVCIHSYLPLQITNLLQVTHVKLYGTEDEVRLSQLPTPPLKEDAQKRCLDRLRAAKELFHTSPPSNTPTAALTLYQCPGYNDFCQLYRVKCVVSTYPRCQWIYLTDYTV